MRVPKGFKRCKCRRNGKELGADCPKLHRKDGSWNPSHGTWYGKSDLPVPPGAKRATLQAGGFGSSADLEAWFKSAIELLDIPRAGPGGHTARLEILAMIRQSRKDNADLPEAADLRLRYATGARFEPGTTGEYLTSWLARHRRLNDWTEATLTEYTRVTTSLLIPHLGKTKLDELTADGILDMFDKIEERNQAILDARESEDPAVRKTVAGKQTAGLSTKRRYLAVIRSALAEASSSQPGRPRLLSVNVAAGIGFGRDRGAQKGARAKARLWTAEREKKWRRELEIRADGMNRPSRFIEWKRTSARPSNVMIWRPEHTGRFLDSIVEDRLYSAFAVIAYCGLRRGEACGLRWEDIDWDSGSIMIGPTRVQAGWTVIDQDHAKAEASEDWVRLEEIVMGSLKLWRKQQREERLAWGEAWSYTGYVWTHEDGQPYHPGQMTQQLYRLSFETGLPPIRLHDLRHGAATMALAAGRPMKEVSVMLRHSSESITSDIYASVLPELKAATSAAVASMIPRKVPTGN